MLITITDNEQSEEITSISYYIYILNTIMYIYIEYIHI